MAALIFTLTKSITNIFTKSQTYIGGNKSVNIITTYEYLCISYTYIYISYTYINAIFYTMSVNFSRNVLIVNKHLANITRIVIL